MFYYVSHHYTMPTVTIRADCEWDLTVAVYPECCSAPLFKSTQILPSDFPPPWPPLASCCGLHQIQDDGAGLQGHQRNYTCLPPNTGQTTRPSESASLIYISWPTDTSIDERKQSSLSEVATLLYFRTSVVERTPDQSQDSGITRQLPQKTWNSSFQTKARPRIAWLSLVSQMAQSSQRRALFTQDHRT